MPFNVFFEKEKHINQENIKKGDVKMNVAKFSKVSYEQFKEDIESCFPHIAEGDKKRIYVFNEKRRNFDNSYRNTL